MIFLVSKSKEICLELKKGDMVFLILALHSRGINSDINYVRCTFQARIAF